jgi:hypothetical protein
MGAPSAWEIFLRTIRYGFALLGLLRLSRLRQPSALPCMFQLFLHHFSRDECTMSLRKARNSLCPNGQALIIEFVPNEDRVSPPLQAMFAFDERRYCPERLGNASPPCAPSTTRPTSASPSAAIGIVSGSAQREQPPGAYLASCTRRRRCHGRSRASRRHKPGWYRRRRSAATRSALADQQPRGLRGDETGSLICRGRTCLTSGAQTVSSRRRDLRHGCEGRVMSADRRAELERLVADFRGPVRRVETLVNVHCPACRHQGQVALSQVGSSKARNGHLIQRSTSKTEPH